MVFLIGYKNTPGNLPGFPTISINQWKIKSVNDNQCQPVSTSGISKWVRPPTHHQGVVGVCPTGPTLKKSSVYKHFVDAFFMDPCTQFAYNFSNGDSVMKFWVNSFCVDILGW